MSLPAGPGHGRLSRGARRLPCPDRGEGDPSGPHRLARDHGGLPDYPPGPEYAPVLPGSGENNHQEEYSHGRAPDIAMVEASRLTRQGRLAEATALIQQTLATPAATRRAPDGQSAEEEGGGTAGRHPAPLPPSPALA